jgi:hypothetical protein
MSFFTYHAKTLLLFSVCFSIVLLSNGQSKKDCSNLLQQQNEAVSMMDHETARVQLDDYRNCLRKSNDPKIKGLLQHLDLYDFVSVAADGNGGWGQLRGGFDRYMFDRQFRPGLNMTTQIFPFIGNFAVFVSNRLYGVIDSKGKIIIPAKYNEIKLNENGLWAVGSGNKYGFADRTGKLVIPMIYSDAFAFYEGLAAVQKNGKYGFINPANKIVIPFIYDKAISFSGGLAWVKKAGKFSYINKKGETVIPAKYDDAHDFMFNSAAVAINGKYSLINPSGNVISTEQYDAVWVINRQLPYLIVYRNGRAGCINRKGEVLLPCSYDEVRILNKEIFRVMDNGIFKPFYVSTKTFGPNTYEILSDIYNEDGSVFKREGKYGYVDTNYKEIIPPVYERGSQVFLNGLAKVYLGDKIGYVNRENKMVIPVEYDYEMNNREGILILRKRNKYVLYATDGKKIKELPEGVMANDNFYNGVARILKDFFLGYIDKQGEFIIAPVYKDLPSQHTGIVPAKRNQLWGAIDLKGKEIIPFKYSEEQQVQVLINRLPAGK